MKGRAGGRAAWSAVDQGLSSAGNFAATLAVARYSSERDVGAFAIAFTLYQLVLGLSRALVSENETLHHDFKVEGFLTRDPRMKERKKYGLAGASKRFQYSKR